MAEKLTPLQRKIKNLTNRELLDTSFVHKKRNIWDSSYWFQRRYNMLIDELKKRDLFKN